MTQIKTKVARWAEPFERAPIDSRYFGAFGGRGSGKSHDFAERLVRRCLQKKTDAVCVREVQKSLNQSVKKLIEAKIEALGVGSAFEVQTAMIKCPHDGVIIFQGMQNHTAESIKSLEGYDIAWVEEAQTLSQVSLDMLRPTIRKPNSQIWFTWNPRLETDPVDVFLRGEVPPEKSIIVETNYDDNPWFPDVLKEEMSYDRGRDFDKYLHVWKGQYKTYSEAVVFKNWSVEDFETPPEAELRLGADWGFAVDPTVLVRCFIVGRKLYIDHEAYQVGCEITDTPALFMTVPDAERWPITADSSRPETISHVRNNGFPKLYPAVKGAGSVEDGIEWLKSFDIVVHPRCVHTIKELESYRYKQDSATNEVLPVLADKDNHVIDAIRYACEGARRAKRVAKRPATHINPIKRSYA